MTNICPACQAKINSVDADYVTCPCGHRFYADETTLVEVQ